MSTFTIAPSDFHIKCSDEILSLYQFDTKTAKHYFCTNCGIYPFHQSSLKLDQYRVNLGCVDNVDTSQLLVDVFDGKSI